MQFTVEEVKLVTRDPRVKRVIPICSVEIEYPKPRGATAKATLKFTAKVNLPDVAIIVCFLHY